MYQHKNPAMLTPLKHMARVLIFLSISIVQAQTLVNNSSILCYVSADNATHEVNAQLIQSKPHTITCSYGDANPTIPKFIQFNCSGGASLLTVKVFITDGSHVQIINRDIQVNGSNTIYEMAVLAYASEEIIQSGKAKISSIEFSNNMNTEIVLDRINFSKSSSNYEVKLNQVFTVDMGNLHQKNYLIKASLPKEVSINLYNTNGEFSKKFIKSLLPGENYIQFEEMQIKQGKYVIAITENDSKKAPNSKLSVMY